MVILLWWSGLGVTPDGVEAIGSLLESGVVIHRCGSVKGQELDEVKYSCRQRLVVEKKCSSSRNLPRLAILFMLMAALLPGNDGDFRYCTSKQTDHSLKLIPRDSLQRYWMIESKCGVTQPRLHEAVLN